MIILAVQCVVLLCVTVNAEPPRGRNGRWSGALLPPPARQTAPATYGPPPAPKPSYGPPTTPPPQVDITTLEPQAEDVPTDQPERLLRGGDRKTVSRGQYYLVGDGGRRLQRVVYVTEKEMGALIARLVYRDVQPIQGPFYNGDLFQSPFIPQQQS